MNLVNPVLNPENLENPVNPASEQKEQRGTGPRAAVTPGRRGFKPRLRGASRRGRFLLPGETTVTAQDSVGPRDFLILRIL